jgi:hypothetical protein
MKKSLMLVSLLFLAVLSIARAESPNISTDQVNKQDSFLLALNDNNRDTNLTDLLVDRFNPPIGAGCGRPCEKDSHCDTEPSCNNCIKGECRP